MRLKAKSRAGFSLVELMVVVAVLAVLAVISAPALDDYIPKYRVDGAAKALSTEMHLLRMRAISKNLRHRATFDSGAQTITLQAEAVDGNGNPTGSFATAYKTLYLGATGNDHEKVSLGRNSTNAGTDGKPPSGSTTTNFNDDDVIFFPNGRADNSGFFFLIPSGDITSGKKVNIRAIEITIAGGVQKHRYTDEVWGEY